MWAWRVVSRFLPVGEGAVEFARDGQVGALIGMLRGQGFVDVDAETGRFAGMHVTSVECVVMREDFVGESGVMHVLLDAEVMNSEAEVERGGHGDRREIGGSVIARADLVEGSEVCRFLRVGDAATVDDGHAYVVDQLLSNKVVGVPDGVKDFAGGDWGGGVPADELEGLLQLGGTRIFHPEEMIGFERFAEPRGLDRGEAVMDVVEKMKIGTEFDAELFEESRDEVEIPLCRPETFGGKPTLGWLVWLAGFGYAVT